MVAPVAAAAAIPWVKIGLAAASGIFSMIATGKSKDAEEEAIKQKAWVADDNARLADLEFYDRAGKAHRDGLFHCHSMKLQLRESGVSGASFEAWVGQSFAELESENSQNLSKGRERSDRYHREADWLRGNAKAVRSSKRWSQLATAVGVGAGMYGMYSKATNLNSMGDGLLK